MTFTRLFPVLLFLCALLQIEGAVPFTCQTWTIRDLKAGGDVPETWTIGAKHLLFYRARFTDTVETEPIYVDEAEALLTQVNKQFIRMSYGLFSFDWVISPLLQLDHDSAYYASAGFNTLLFDVRNAATAAGLNYEDFDLDLIRCPQIPGFPEGQANIRDRGAVVHSDRVNVYVHEMGHNLGLFHANNWQHDHPQLQPRSSPPFPSDASSHAEPFLFDPASLLGDCDLRSPGRSIEYGDLFDTMASGTGDYNAAFKARLGWLTTNQIQTTSTNGVYRLYAYDMGSTKPDRLYGLRLDRLIEGRGQNFTFRYWASFRSDTSAGENVPFGLELHWMDQAESYTGQLLDMRPATPLNVLDAPLPLGRTFTDAEAAISITPVDSGKDADGALWMDVQLHFGIDSTNRPPSLALENSSSGGTIDPGESALFTALASDPDGDQVSFFWDFGDGTRSAGSSQAQKTWENPGQYVVRCEASDGKGGMTARQLLVRVGVTPTFAIQGQIRSENGVPLVGTFVSNGKINAISGMLPDFVTTQTDSDGTFILPNLAPGDYPVAAAAYGWLLQRTDSSTPVHIDSANVSGLEFTATELPSVQVTVTDPAVDEGQGTLINFTRTGSTKDPLELSFVLNGTAGAGQDFAPYDNQTVTIPAGSISVSIPFQALEDLEEEPDKYVTITAIPASSITRAVVSRGATNEITSAYPGFEPRVTDLGEVWFQTQPAFRREPEATASLTIHDTTKPGIQRIYVVADNSTGLERPLTPITLRVYRIGSKEAPLQVNYSLAGDAINGVDYDLLPLSVTIPIGNDSAEVLISPIADGMLEGSETVEFSLEPSPNYIIQDPSVAQLTIQEDSGNSSPNSLKFGRRFDATIVVRMAGEIGKTYVLETSIDLIHWTPYSTNQITSSPVGIPIPPFSDSNVFYRSHQADDN